MHCGAEVTESSTNKQHHLSPCRGAAHCSRFYRWPTTGGTHAWLSACVARGTPTHCGGASWVSSGRCPSPAVCGFPVVWVVCEDVRCGVRRVAGGCLSLVRGGGVFHAVGVGLHMAVPVTYRYQYPAPGSPAVAQRVQQLLSSAGLPCGTERKSGILKFSKMKLRLMTPSTSFCFCTLSRSGSPVSPE